MPRVKIEEQIGGAVVRLKGQFIGGEETAELQQVLTKLAEEKKEKLIIDLKNVSYLNSTALGVLIAAHASFIKRGGRIILTGLADSIENLFVITKLTLVFEIAPNVEEAIKKI